MMARGKWKVYVCRHAEQYQRAYDFITCQDYCNKNNKSRSQHNNNVNAQTQHSMFSPLLNEHTGKVQCVENDIEYHKLQYLKMSDSTHIWIPSWQNKNQKEIQNPNKGKSKEICFSSDCCKSFKKSEVQEVG